MQDAAAVDEGELMMLEERGGDVAVDEGIAAGLGKGAPHPQAQNKAAE